MTDRKKPPSIRKTSTPATGGADIAAFLAEVRSTPLPGITGNGRLIFALDATMSRQPAWDLACHLQSAMFDTTTKTGGLEVQLAYFRGHREAQASRWVRDARSLNAVMNGITCRGGLTQIGRILDHAGKAAAKKPVAALVYVGDAMEEDVDLLCDKAGKLALRNTRAFMFLEGHDPTAAQAYAEIARLTGGVFLPFNAAAVDELRALLAAIATFAAGGHAALEASGTGAARRLLGDLR